jgi:hypothetical protein
VPTPISRELPRATRPEPKADAKPAPAAKVESKAEAKAEAKADPVKKQ